MAERETDLYRGAWVFAVLLLLTLASAFLIYPRHPTAPAPAPFAVDIRVNADVTTMWILIDERTPDRLSIAVSLNTGEPRPPTAPVHALIVLSLPSAPGALTTTCAAPGCHAEGTQIAFVMDDFTACSLGGRLSSKELDFRATPGVSFEADPPAVRLVRSGSLGYLNYTVRRQSVYDWNGGTGLSPTTRPGRGSGR